MMKTGGLIDVPSALPAALHTQSLGIKRLLPDDREMSDKCRHTDTCTTLPKPFGPWDIRIIDIEAVRHAVTAPYRHLQRIL